MQIMVLATQNEAPIVDLGVATSSITFFRTIGGSVGVSVFGALFTSRLTQQLSGSMPETLTPEAINQLPLDQKAHVAGAFADSITNVFVWAVPLLLIGWALTWLLKEKPLRTASGDMARRNGTSGNGDHHVLDYRPAAAGVATPGTNGNGHASTTGRERERERRPA
jgi:hypothetical protein